MNSLLGSPLASCARLRRFLSPCLVLLALVSLAPSGAGQIPLEPTPVESCSLLDFEGGNLVCLPGGPSNDYGEMVAGDLNRNLIPEVALLQDTNLVVVHDASIGNDARFVETATDVLAVCYSPDAGANEPGLFYTTVDGLKRVAWNADDRRYDVVQTYETSEYLLWKGAVEIHADQGFLFGVDATRKKVIRSAVNSGTIDTPVVLITLVQPSVRDMRLMNWDGGPKVIVLQHTLGLQVRRQDGSVLVSRPAMMPNDVHDAIAVAHRFDDAANDADTLAWISPVQVEVEGVWQTKQYLVLYSSRYGSPYSRGPFELTAGLFTSAAAGDLDGDGKDALVFSNGLADEVHALEGLDFVEGQQLLYKPTTQPHYMWELGSSQNPSGPVLCANLFNDSTTDPESVEYGLAAMARVSGDIGALRLLPTPEGKTISYSMFQPGDFAQVTYSCGSPRTWRINVGDGWGPGAATYMEIKVRKMLPNQQNAEAVPFVHAFFERNAEPELTFQQPANDPPDTCYFAIVRPVNASSPSAITQAWRSSILGISATCAGFCKLEGLPGAYVGQEVDIVPDDPSETGCPLPMCSGPCTSGGLLLLAAGRYVPSAVPQSRVPSAGPGGLPGDPPQ